MLYRFICPKCKNRKEISIPSNELKDYSAICDSCGNKMRRDWKSSLQVSESDRSENIEETSWLKEGMKKRFSGKSQIYY